MTRNILSTLGLAALTLSFSACDTSKYVTVNNGNTAANKSNTAVVVNTTANSANAANTANTANTSANSSTSSAKMEGDVLNIDEAGVTMTVPKGFKFSKDGDDTIVKTADEGVDIRFSVPKDGDYDKVVGDAAKEIDDYLKDVKITEQPTKDKVNGMDATSMSGTAKNDSGEEVMWNLTVINAPKRPVLANIYAEKSSLEKEQKSVSAFLDSVKKQ